MPSGIVSVLTGMIPMYTSMLARHEIDEAQVPEEIREAVINAYHTQYAKLIEAEKEQQAATISADALKKVSKKKA